MKKQNKPWTKAHLLRGVVYLLLFSAGTLLGFFRPEAAMKGSQRTLTFADRVAYQRTIEEVYWRHRIWPKERPDPKPSLDAVMSEAQLEKKVEDYLRNSQALEEYWQRPLTAGQLQTEMDRMAKHTKQPEVLRELFAALGHDPIVIAECLARPVLAERTLATAASVKESWVAKPETQVPVTMAAVNANYTLPVIASPSGGCTDDTWTPTSTTSAPDGRSDHTAVWTGSEMIIWGGVSASGYLNTGGRYNPSTDSWTATSTTNAPTARYVHTAVWTGSEMIVWGGSNGSDLNTGGRYNPGTDSWTATNTAGAPAGRVYHTAVWTGSEMIVWGGSNGSDLNTGGRYNPGTDSWTATSTSNAPAARDLHTAVWSGSEMTVWGGWNGNNFLNTGGRYNPSTDNWTATSTVSAPDARWEHTAIWTGTEMIIWGGNLNTGGRYSPSTDSWTATSTTNAPDGRAFHTAVWTGSDMIVWGGGDDIRYLNTGGRYCAAAPNSTPTPTATSTPTATATATPTPTPTGCSVTSPACGSIVGYAPTEFTVNLSDPANPATVQASDFTVNGTPADSFSLSNGNTTISFFFFPSPALQGGNVMHIPAGAFNCGNGPVLEFNCGFRYFRPRPRPTPAPRP
jgi:N-acetylneuraminic acid mutarotase